jgi:hypothetical protein
MTHLTARHAAGACRWVEYLVDPAPELAIALEGGGGGGVGADTAEVVVGRVDLDGVGTLS